LGTGSGVIAISLKKIHKNMNMYATDTSPHAIRITKRNAQLNKTQITLIHNKNNAHWLTGLDIFPELVICNPPFLSDKSFFSEKLATEFPEIKIEPQDSIRSFDPNGMNHYKTIINEFVSISHNNSRLKYLALEMPDNLESALSTELNKKSHSLSWNFLLASDKHKRFVIIKKMN
jgi:methylase of polypeptide subunit release factors